MKNIPVGAVRIKTDLQFYEKTKTGWKKSKTNLSSAVQAAKLYKACRKLKLLIDHKDKRFLKGMLYESKALGGRVNVLPNGEVLEKAFSLFSPHLTIHDQDSDDHWDVLYQNVGGTFSYVYTLEKRAAHRVRKYKKVDEFEKHYKTLVRNVTKALQGDDYMALPLYTLLKTYMRIGNEIYYKAHKHKGLSTLQKKDVSIKGNIVTFNFLGKDGVPVTISKKFPDVYVKKLRSVSRKCSGFIFTNNGKVLHERDFKKAFRQYCGEEFYPHIIRSHYATQKVKNFLKRGKVNKKDVEQLFLEIANKLGHKKFNKKDNKWQVHHTVTVNSYIQPSLVEKLKWTR